jgi:hypothetical protein
MINFLLFVSKKQTDPSFRDMFARLAFYLYLFLEKARSVQSGGLKIVRGNQVMDVPLAELQPGDLTLESIGTGVQIGQDVVQYGNNVYNQQQQQLQLQLQPPQQMTMYRDEEHENRIDDLKKQVQIEQMRGILAATKLKNKLINGEVPASQHLLDAGAAGACGFCCTVFVNVSQQLSNNAWDNFKECMYSNFLAVAGIASSLPGAKLAKAATGAASQVSDFAERVGVDAINWFIPRSTNIQAVTEETLSSTTIPAAVQEGYFNEIWNKMHNRINKGIYSKDTSSQCGIFCCVFVYTSLAYNTFKRAKDAQLKIMEGSSLNSALNDDKKEQAKNVARVAAAAGAGIAMANGVPPPIALGVLSAANTIISNPVDNIENQSYTRLQPTEENGPEPILIGRPQMQNANPDTNFGLRQRNVNNLGQNGGYKKFKKTKRNNRKTIKIKRNNRKSRKSRKYKKNKKDLL